MINPPRLVTESPIQSGTLKKSHKEKSEEAKMEKSEKSNRIEKQEYL